MAAIVIGGVGVLGLLLALFVWTVTGAVHGLLSSAEPTRFALVRAEANPQVVQRLGKPIRAGRSITGNFQLSNDTGHADLEIPIAGPHGKAEIHVVADMEFGRWHYETMRVGSPDSEETIGLLENAGSGK